MAKASYITLPFPVRGIDKSVPYSEQPARTTHKAINVRPTPPISGRTGGGSREGLRKLFRTKMYGLETLESGTYEPSTRINHIEVFPVTPEGSSTDRLYNVEVEETFVGRAYGDTLGGVRTAAPLTTSSSNYNTLSIPASIGSDLVVFCRNEANSGKVDNYYDFRVTDASGSNTSATSPGYLTDAVEGGLTLGIAVSGTDPNIKARRPGVAIAYQTTNDIEVTFYASPTDPVTGGANGNAGAQNDYNGFGPFIRGSRDLSTYYLATLEYGGSANTAKLKIWSVAANGTASQVGSSSDAASVIASATPTLTGSGPTIRIWQQGDYINATCTWARGFTNTETVLTTSYNAGSPSQLADNDTDPTNRGGVASYFATDGANEDNDHSRYCIERIKYTKRVPTGLVEVGSCNAASVNTKGGRYYLPVGSTSAHVTSAPALVQFGNTDTNSDSLWDGVGSDVGPTLDNHNVPRIDSGFKSSECTAGVLQGMTATTRTSYIHLQNANTGNSARVHVEVRGRTLKIDPLDDQAGVTGIEDIPGVALRLAITGATNNFKSGLFLEWMHGAGDTTTDPYLSRAMQDSWETIRLVGINNGTRTVLKTFSVTATSTSSTGTFTAVASNNTITRASGSFIDDGFCVGQSVTSSGFTGGNNTTFTITALSATVMTTNVALTNEAGGGNEVLTVNATAIHMPPFRADAYQRWEDSGHAIDSSSYRLYWKVNGIVQLILRPASTSTTGLEHGISGTTYSDWIASLNATDLSVLSASKNVGLCFWPGATGTIDSYTYGGRVVNIDLESPTSVTNTEAQSIILAFLRGTVYSANADAGVISRMSGSGPFNNLVQSTFVYNQCFAVDGGSSVYMEYPFTEGVMPWSATAGTLPENCKLIAFWQGRVVLAAPTSDARQWYLSRLGDPFDWDYGADPRESSAIAGSNSRFGLPAEPIIALIPAADDVLYVCGTTTINALVGDPGFGGQFVLRSPGVGIIGPRAWCIDDRGMVFFMGTGGMYVIPPGGVPQNVSRGRAGSEFDNCNPTTTLVQMAFDSVSRCVYIFMTQNDGTASTHYVYDIETDSFWTDRYDLTGFAGSFLLNPLSVAEGVSSDPTLRRLMIGCGDGYIRILDDDRGYDDGYTAGTTEGDQNIVSTVELVVPDGGGVMETMAEEMMIFGYFPDSDLTINWKTGYSPQDTAEDVAWDDPRVPTFTISASSSSYQVPVSLRMRGGSHKCQLTLSSGTDGWGLERIVVKMSPRGRRR